MLTNSKKTLTIIGSFALAIFIVALLGAFYLEENAAAVEITSTIQTAEKTITTTGTATRSTSPDLLVIQFGVETQEKTAKNALDKNSSSMNQIINAIKSTGVIETDISTARFNIYPVYEGYEDQITKRWMQELSGYRVTNTVTVETTKLKLAADIIDGAVAAGANKVDSVAFTLSPELQLQIQDELIGKAVQNAQKKAENALIPVNYKIVGIKMISLSDFVMPPPMPMYEKSYDASARPSASTPLFSSDQDVTTTANVVFLIGID
ncbi:MAG: SIMPL domain-containing protein [Nitrosarchaeum sp.]